LRMLVGQPAEGTSGSVTDTGKRLQAETAEMRARLSDVTKEAEQLKKDLVGVTGDNTRLRTLVKQLEEQLTHMNQTAAAAENKTTDDVLRNAASNAAAMVSGRPNTPMRAFGSPGLNTPGVGGEVPQSNSAAAVLEIVCGQRDRSRARIVELEAEKAKLMEVANARETEAQLLRADNLKLYERIKFLESYQDSNPNTQIDISELRSTHQQSRSPSGGSDVESRYNDLYEQSVDPFSEFSRKEHVLRRHRLGRIERIVLQSFNFLTRSKASRYAFFFYALTLHVFLLFFMLHAPSCPKTTETGGNIPVMDTQDTQGTGA